MQANSIWKDHWYAYVTTPKRNPEYFPMNAKKVKVLKIEKVPRPPEKVWIGGQYVDKPRNAKTVVTVQHHETTETWTCGAANLYDFWHRYESDLEARKEKMAEENKARAASAEERRARYAAEEAERTERIRREREERERAAEQQRLKNEYEQSMIKQSIRMHGFRGEITFSGSAVYLNRREVMEWLNVPSYESHSTDTPQEQSASFEMAPS